MSKEKKGLKPIDAPVYGYWEALYSSFFSKRLYVDVGKRWRGIGFVYLLLAIALLSIPFALRIGLNFNKAFAEEITVPLSQLPLLYVQNGVISIDKPVPYFIKNTHGQVVLIVDTSGKITEFNQQYPYLSILITKDTIYFKLPAPNLTSSPLPPTNTSAPIPQRLDSSVNTIFNGAQFVNDPIVFKLKLTAQLVIYPLIVVVLSAFFIALFLVIALLGQVFSNVFFAFQISYLQATRLLVVSATPMLLLLFIYMSVNHNMMGVGFVLLAVFIAYYIFALYAFRSESRQMAAR